MQYGDEDVRVYQMYHSTAIIPRMWFWGGGNLRASDFLAIAHFQHLSLNHNLLASAHLTIKSCLQEFGMAKHEFVRVSCNVHTPTALKSPRMMVACPEDSKYTRSLASVGTEFTRQGHGRESYGGCTTLCAAGWSRNARVYKVLLSEPENITSQGTESIVVHRRFVAHQIAA